ncbi:SUMF1/EgtB/PvdO family nonheme iron enzyme [Mesotoga sp.]|uniref:formylglycine-generating enzyme family protein n=1 Tax=Mesotoga sp. TaxID=2053577 RepID=UPI001BD318DE|nr:SUMF1/EgtB/PvdO family nonheme iron enzyme [Mesotoga sp.]
MGNSSESQIWKFSTVKVGAFLKTPSGIEMVYVEGGTFTMGDTWGDGDDDEKPTHKVTLTYDFYIGKYETTFDEYDAFCEATGREKPKDKGWGRGQRPVIYVSWHDAIAYCNWLSEKEGLPKANNGSGDFLGSDGKITTDPDKAVGYRLPTEAEWEYAARGGKYSKGYKYSGSNDGEEVAWFSGNSGDRTRDVGRLSANELGIFDMSGNVWELCNDWSSLYPSTSQIDPYIYGPIHLGYGDYKYYKVIRGGYWYSRDSEFSVATREEVYYSLNGNYDRGFRIAKTAQSSDSYPYNTDTQSSNYNTYSEGTGKLTLVVTVGLTKIFFLTTHDLVVSIRGPISKEQTFKDISAGSPVQVAFYDIPNGEYQVEAKWGDDVIAKSIVVNGDTVDFQMIIY